MAKEIKIPIVGDSSDYKKSLKEAEQASGNFAKSTEGHGRAIAAAGAVAATAVGAFAASAIDAASDYNETVSKSKVIFGQASASVIDFAENAAESFGLSQQSALDAEATFATFGKGAGLAGDDLGKFAQDLTGLAADMASFSNTSPEQAIEAIGAALRGEAEPIRAYGVLLDDATLKAAAMKLGIYDGVGALTQQQKVLAAQKAIFDQTSDAQGDFARTSDGLAGKQKILSAQIENTKIALGEGLIPVAIKAFEVLQKLAFGGDAPKKSFDKLAVASGKTSTQIINDFQDLMRATDEARSSLDQGLHGIGDFFSQVRHPFEGSDIENIRSFDKAFGDLFNKDPDAARALVTALHDLRDASDAGNKSAQEFADSYDLTVEKLKELDDQVGIVGEDTRTTTDAFEHMGIASQDTAAAALEQAKALAETATKARDAQRDTDNLKASWDALTGALSEEQAWIDVQDAFADTQAAGVASLTAQAEGAADADQKARDYASSMISLKEKVIDYAKEVGGLPPEVVSKILADIDEGSVATAEQALDRIAHERQVIYNAQVADHREFERRAGGGPVKAGQIYMVGEHGPELFASDEAGSILSTSQTNRQTSQMFPGGRSVPRSGSPGDQIYGGGSSQQSPGALVMPEAMPGDQRYVATSNEQNPGAVAAAIVDRVFDRTGFSGSAGGGDTITITGPINIYMPQGSSPDEMMQTLATYVKRNGPGQLAQLAGIQ